MQIDLETMLTRKVDLVSSNGLSEYILPLTDNKKKLIYTR